MTPSRFRQVALMLLASAALIYGLWSGEGALVWRKAAYLCLECIGLG